MTLMKGGAVWAVSFSLRSARRLRMAQADLEGDESRALLSAGFDGDSDPLAGAGAIALLPEVGPELPETLERLEEEG